MQAVLQHDLAKGFHGRAIERYFAQDQRMGAALLRDLEQVRRGLMRHVVVEWRRAQGAVGMGADQRGQRDFVGACH